MDDLQEKYNSAASELQIAIIGRVSPTRLTDAIIKRLIQNIVEAKTPKDRQGSLDNLVGYFEGYLKNSQPGIAVSESKVSNIIGAHFTI